LTDVRYAALAAEALGVDRAIGWDRRGRDRGWSGMKRVLARLPARDYDVIADLQGKARTRILARRLRAKRRLTLSKRKPLAALGALLGRDPPIADRHAAEIYLGALAPLGVQAIDLAPRLNLDGFRRTPGLKIGFAPGATHATKRWPAERFIELARGLKRTVPHAELILVGGPSDRPLLDVLRSQAGDARFSAIDVAAMDVLGLARMLADLDLLISVDTGPAHVAAGLGVPVVAIFGPTSPVRWGPRGDRHRIVSLSLDCAPCSNFGGASCPRADRRHACLETLPVERVLEAALSALGDPKLRKGLGG
jgi:heptosyltransferase II